MEKNKGLDCRSGYRGPNEKILVELKNAGVANLTLEQLEGFLIPTSDELDSLAGLEPILTTVLEIVEGAMGSVEDAMDSGEGAMDSFEIEMADYRRGLIIDSPLSERELVERDLMVFRAAVLLSGVIFSHVDRLTHVKRLFFETLAETYICNHVGLPTELSFVLGRETVARLKEEHSSSTECSICNPEMELSMDDIGEDPKFVRHLIRRDVMVLQMEDPDIHPEFAARMAVNKRLEQEKESRLENDERRSRVKIALEKMSEINIVRLFESLLRVEEYRGLLATVEK